MKEVRMKNMITSGPQSHILEGVNWEEARQSYAASQVDGSVPGHHVVMVGAASKGIIQRDFQHNATVYKSAYAKNPFDSVSDEELAEYRLLIERKQRGEHGKSFFASFLSQLLTLIFVLQFLFLQWMWTRFQKMWNIFWLNHLRVMIRATLLVLLLLHRHSLMKKVMYSLANASFFLSHLILFYF